MRRFFRFLGSLLVLTAFMVGASFFLRTGGGSAPASKQIEQLPTPEQIQQVPAAEQTPAAVSAPPPVVPPPVATTPTPEARLAITRLVIASIDLDTDVVPAPLVESNGVLTWMVPAFKAGHLEDTAGAGKRGNAVLMGHVSSIHSGDVFKNLDRVQVGDEVEVFSSERRFTYLVYETRSVPRTDVAMVEPMSEPIISLFTCTGLWDPVAWDFMERLFVRARLVAS
jgi:LPXTG-site transpeptidase (sortase) family protein